MPAPFRSTAAIIKTLNPLSPSLMLKSLLIVSAMLELINAVSFSAGQFNYDMLPVSPAYPEHNFTVFRYVYNALWSGACGANGFRQHEFNDDSTVVSVPGVTIKKEGYDTNTTTDQCLKNLAYSAVNYTSNTPVTSTPSYNTLLPEDGSYRTRNIIWGVLLPIGGILLIFSLAMLIYTAYHKYKARISNAFVNLEAGGAEVNAEAAAVDAAGQPPVADIPQEVINKSVEHSLPKP